MMSKKGFTLVELLIVIAVIGILSGVFFIGVTGFRNSAMDARRIADLKNIQNSLELYYSKCRLYPNDRVQGSNCPAEPGNTPSGGFAGLVNILQNAQLGITAVPNDPVPGQSYQYISDGTNYVLAARLSGDRDILREPATIRGRQTIGGGSPIDCYIDANTPNNYTYCVGGNR